MRTVNRFESNLLKIVSGLVDRAPRTEILPLILRAMERPACLGRDAVELLQAALAKGCVRMLAAGGWRRERFLRGERPVEGRLWQRTSPAELTLSFSRNTIDFLIWLTASGPAAARGFWRPADEKALTLGDRFVLFLAFRALRGTDSAKVFARRKVFASHALCWLAFPNEFAGVQTGVPLDWSTWTAAGGACIVEALQHELADHWMRAERSKEEIALPEQMQSLGDVQRRVLGEWFSALEQSGRRDLCRFVLMAASRLLREQTSADAWLRRLDVRGLSMDRRAETYRAAFAFLESLAALRTWERQARNVGYFDDGYAASQLWKSDWERFQADAACAVAGDLLRRADPIRAAGKGECQAEFTQQN